MVTKKPNKNSLKSLSPQETFSRSPKKLEETQETNETQFWKEVEECSQSLIANLIEKTLPISAIPPNFNLEKDTDYRVLLRDDLPNSYIENEEYLAKIEQGNWTEEDVEYVAQELACQYFDLVVRSLVDWLSEYNGFESTSLSQLKE